MTNLKKIIRAHVKGSAEIPRSLPPDVEEAIARAFGRAIAKAIRRDDAERRGETDAVSPIETPKVSKTSLMTLQQASRESGVPYMSVRHLVKKGHLPSVQLGDSRRIWIRRTDFERLIETSTSRPDADGAPQRRGPAAPGGTVTSPSAVTNLETLPLILTLKDLASIYRVSMSTIRRGLQNGTFRPRPVDKYPYRWKRDDVAADLKRPRDEHPRRAHGFARTKKGLTDAPSQ